mmetsp:Transcript_6123/g.15785  ORF Transcript_6123/g.15785 Transcript_6123/m.15785 type:complete len:212 (-) Transcript_6123:416-1051(-)
MWPQMGAEKPAILSTGAAMKASGLTLPALAKPPTSRTPTSSVISYTEKSPKSAQNALGCLALYSCLSCAARASSVTLKTRPVMLTRPSEAPRKPGAVTVRLHLQSASMSPVWDESVLKTKMGRPLSSLAPYPTTDPLGKPSAAERVERTPYRPRSTRVRASSACSRRLARCWWRWKEATSASSVAAAAAPPGTLWPSPSSPPAACEDAARA